MSAVDCLPRPSIEELRDRILAEYSQRVLGGRPVPAGDLSEIMAYIFAGAAWQVHGDVRRLYDQLFLETMCSENVLTMGTSLNLGRKAASKARGWVTITGTPGAVIPSNINVVTTAGLGSIVYELDPDASNPAAIDDEGEAALLMRAVVAGKAANIAGDTELTTTAAIAGIGSTATVTADGMTGGADQETLEEMRQRLILRRKTAVVAANLAWYRTIALTYPGVTRFCFRGCDCVECCAGPFLTAYAFLDNVYPATQGVPPRAVALDIQAFLWGSPMGKGLGKAPVGAFGQILCAEPLSTVVTFRGAARSINPRRNELISQAIRSFYREAVCVGGTFCASDLMQAANVVAPDVCFSGVTVTGTNVSAIDGGVQYKLPCNAFPTLQSVLYTAQ